MSNLRQVGLGILAALVSVAILFGSLSVALMENAPRESLSSFITWTPQPTATTTLVPTRLISPSPTSSSIPTFTGTPSSSLTPSPTSSLPATSTPTTSLTPTVTPTPCHYPSGWSLIKVQPGDTLDSLAAAYNITPNALFRNNCLTSRDLSNGQRLYVPVRIAPTQTTVHCVPGAPYGWVNYTVKLGDTLSHLAQLTGTTVQQLMKMNCLPSDRIDAGQHLYIPRSLSTSTKAPTAKPSKTPRPPTSTPRPPVDTRVPPPSNTPVPPPADTPAAPDTLEPTTSAPYEGG